MLNKISWIVEEEKTGAKTRAFLYCDPPYLETTNNYNASWTKQDTVDLFDVCVNSGLRFAISEFDNPVIIDLAKQHNLKITEVCERKTLKNRNMEILITNYEPTKQLQIF